ncbi:diacylglycerol/lipid kinase family protein [Saccharopolyspora mangrovi]|uniref:YegS/Rv2252/BmrU family lipid kinase n=1 Tax=Saccharopolyspora mangrovi TaxID=3082379 RepID=A0ABU6AIT2_9PSEU|nr:YegS/Rv2252/BmrU family lipid kinase [Saccharopolyspora sp. S2-29]MEB3371421.1 YegS/Rv2252/BmrU family lipid kinase [Saccharopolyspora sp. S2-29]
MVNVHSRTGGKAYAYALDRLRELGVPLGATYPLHDPSRLVETVDSAAKSGHDLIIVGGGDGSVSSVVDCLAHRDVPLALLPLGTANDFARTMHIPDDLDGACQTILGSHIVDVDLGLCGDNYYVNRASVGIGAEVAQAMSPQLKRYVGPLAYPVATAKAFLKHRPFAAKLRFPDGDHEDREYGKLLQVSVANGRYFGGGQLAASDSGIDDNALDITVLRQGNISQLAGVVRGLKTGEPNDQVEQFRTRAVEIVTDEPQPINIDGEVVSSTPQTFKVARNALHVVTPRTWADGEAPE